MKKSTTIITAIVLSLSVIGVTAVQAAKDRDGNHDRHARHAVWFITKKLDLDANQEQNLANLKDQMLIAKSAMHEQLGTTREDVRSLIKAESFDQGKALELINTKTATVNTFAPDLVIALGTFLDSLNSEQKEEILEFLNSRGDRKRGHWRH